METNAQKPLFNAITAFDPGTINPVKNATGNATNTPMIKLCIKYDILVYVFLPIKIRKHPLTTCAMTALIMLINSILPCIAVKVK